MWTVIVAAEMPVVTLIVTTKLKTGLKRNQNHPTWEG